MGLLESLSEFSGLSVDTLSVVFALATVWLVGTFLYASSGSFILALISASIAIGVFAFLGFLPLWYAFVTVLLSSIAFASHIFFWRSTGKEPFVSRSRFVNEIIGLCRQRPGNWRNDDNSKSQEDVP